MMFGMPQYEMRSFNTTKWRDISEVDLIQKLHEYFDRVTPAIKEMIMGKEVKTSDAVYRLKRRDVSQVLR